MLTILVLTLLAQDPLEGLSPIEGKRLFDGQCAVCHGIGGGGSTGPSLQKPTLPRAATNADLVRVIQAGIPNTQMPGAWQMTDREARLVATYVRSVGKVELAAITGDPVKGKDLYSRSGCASCHIASGAGRGFGPELTGIGLRRAPAHLRQSITDPDADIAEEFVQVSIGVKGSHQTCAYSGPPLMRVNEDSFTIQVKDAFGRFQSFDKQHVCSQIMKSSLMPSYKTRFQPAQLDDLVAYLAGLK